MRPLCRPIFSLLRGYDHLPLHIRGVMVLYETFRRYEASALQPDPPLPFIVALFCLLHLSSKVRTVYGFPGLIHGKKVELPSILL